MSNPRQQILQKELDLIQDGVKNLDDIIYKNKNFAFLFWGGALFLIADQLSQNEALVGKIHWMIYTTAFIPVAFWIAHVFWQKHLFFLSLREKKIAYFINSVDFSAWCKGDNSIQFPVYDHVGWVFTIQNKSKWKELKFNFKDDHLIDRDEFNWWQTLWYKDAKVYYVLMIITSFAFGYMYNL